MEIGHVKTILLHEWDPLEVGDNPKLADEYDSYLPGVFNIVKSGRSSGDISDYLKSIEDSLGIILPEERRRRAARLLWEKNDAGFT